MRFRFLVDPRYAVIHAMNIAQDDILFDGWEEVVSAAYDADPQAFYLIAGSPEHALPIPRRAALPAVAERAETLLAAVLRKPESKRLVRETRAYARTIQDEWQRNGQRVVAFMEELTGMRLPSKTIDVHFSHPNLRNGMTVDPTTIVWGHTSDFPNYASVYLAHELLHLLTWGDRSDVNHAAIELLADNEIRVRLNGGKYFGVPGHANLRALERAMLPAWNRYLRSPSKDFLRFIEEQKNAPPRTRGRTVRNRG